MISQTFELRKQYGKFQEIPAENCPSHEHVDHCEACGSRKPEKLIAVSANGWVGMVGTTCARILTSGKNPKVDSVLMGTGESYQDGDRVWVYITEEWLRNLGDKVFVSANQVVTRWSGGAYDQVLSNFDNNYWGSGYRDQFLADIYRQGKERGKLSEKQVNAAERALARL